MLKIFGLLLRCGLPALALVSCAAPGTIPPSPSPKPPPVQAPAVSASTALAHLPLTPGATWSELAALEATLAREAPAGRPARPPRLVVDRFPLGPQDLIIARIEGRPSQGAALVLLSCGVGRAGPPTVIAVRMLTDEKEVFLTDSRWTAPDARFGLLLVTWWLRPVGHERPGIGWEVIRVDDGSLTAVAGGRSPAGATIRFVPGATGLSLVRCEGGAAAAALLDPAQGRFGPLRPSDLPCIPYEKIEWLGPSDGEEEQEP